MDGKGSNLPWGNGLGLALLGRRVQALDGRLRNVVFESETEQEQGNMLENDL